MAINRFYEGEDMAQKISILHPSPDITPLKLRGWLYGEAEEIEGCSDRGDRVLVRLFLLERVRFGFTPKKLDALLQGVVDKYPSIQRVELNVVKTPMSLEQMRDVIEEASPFPDLRRYIGYQGDDIVCMVSNIIQENLEPVSQQSGIDFQLGEWFVSVGAHAAAVVHGPYPDEDQAMVKAAQTGATRFTRID